MLALCAGAIWSVVALLTDGSANWMVLPAAAVVVWSLGFMPPLSGPARAVVAFLLLLACIVYAQLLNAASVLAGQLGLPFKEALLTMGPELAWAVARARTPVWALFLLLATAIVLAAYAYRGAARS